MMMKTTMITMIGLKNRSYMKLNTLHTITICTTRLYCTYYNQNSVLLTSAINTIYNQDWNARGVLPFKKNELLELVVRDKYVLSPLQYFVLKKSDIPDFIYEILIMESKRGYLWFENSVDDKWIHLFKPQNSTDLLLLMALSKVLLTLIDSNPNVYKLEDNKSYHYNYLNRMRNVCRVYKIDLSQSIKCIDKFDVMDNIKFIGLNGVVLNLISDFVRLPICDAYVNKRIPSHGIPPIGEISNVIFDIFLISRFDREFIHRYPGVSYTRLGYEVFIATKSNDEFDEEEAEYFIEDVVRLHGDIDYIDNDENDYLVGGSYEEKVIFLEESGRVSVWNSEDV